MWWFLLFVYLVSAMYVAADVIPEFSRQGSLSLGELAIFLVLMLLPPLNTIILLLSLYERYESVVVWRRK